MRDKRLELICSPADTALIIILIAVLIITWGLLIHLVRQFSFARKFPFFTKPKPARLEIKGEFSQAVEIALVIERDAIAKLVCHLCEKDIPISKDDDQYHVRPSTSIPFPGHANSKELVKCSAFEIRSRNKPA